MTDQPANDRGEEKAVPLWLGVAVMAALAIAGGGLIWRYLYYGAGEEERRAARVTVPLPGGPRTAGGGAAAGSEGLAAAVGEAGLPDGVHARDGRVLFKGGDAYLRVVTADGRPAHSFGFFTLGEEEWEHGYLSQGVRRLLADEDYARELGVTAAQRAALRDLPSAPGARWPEGDRERFGALYEAWQSAQGEAQVRAGVELVKALRAYGEAKRAADRAVMTDRVRRIRSVLDAKQVERINPIPRWEGSKATDAGGG